MVTVYEGICYDPTSKQFDLPIYYTLEYFFKLFEVISVGKITTGDPSINFGIQGTKFNRVTYKDLSLESNLSLITDW